MAEPTTTAELEAAVRALPADSRAAVAAWIKALALEASPRVIVNRVLAGLRGGVAPAAATANTPVAPAGAPPNTSTPEHRPLHPEPRAPTTDDLPVAGPPPGAPPPPPDPPPPPHTQQ